MMGGTSLARTRRLGSRLFTERVFVGDAIDIGAGPDGLRVWPGFPLLKSVREWDLPDGDATVMGDLAPASFDLVYSSHCLEHIVDPYTAIRRWWELVKVGGHLVVVVPDEELYERGHWPPKFNGDHRHSFSTSTGKWAPHAVDFTELSYECLGGRLISLVRLEDGFIAGEDRDQTADGTCECGIELVVRKEAA